MLIMIKYYLGLMFIFLSLQLLSCQSSKNKQSDNFNSESAKVPFGDPFILLWEGKYYAYITPVLGK